MKVEQVMEIAKQVLLPDIILRLDRIEGRLGEMNYCLADIDRRLSDLSNRIGNLVKKFDT